jgi:hypothetical protein
MCEINFNKKGILDHSLGFHHCLLCYEKNKFSGECVLGLIHGALNSSKCITSNNHW